jgi:SGNH domain (fused to AT3 domains)
LRVVHGRRRAVAGMIVAGLLMLSLSGTAGAASLRPAPSAAPNDVEPLWHDGCLGFETATRPKKSCVFGDRQGTYTIALVGDSHTSALFPGFNKMAKARHWRLLVLVKIDCPFIDIPIKSSHDFQPYPSCTTWNRRVVAILRKEKPDLTVTIPFRWIFPVNASKATPGREGAAIGRELAKVPGQKVVMVDTPWSDRNVPACLEAHSAQACAIPRNQVLSGGVRTRERRAADVAGGIYLDLTHALCGGFPCRVVSHGILKFRDNHHLTATYTRSLGPVIDAALQRVLG